MNNQDADPTKPTESVTEPINDTFFSLKLKEKDKWWTITLAALTGFGAFMGGLAAILEWASKHHRHWW
jgi:hypothetical protein